MAYLNDTAFQHETVLRRIPANITDALFEVLRRIRTQAQTKADLKRLSERQLRDIALTVQDVDALRFSPLPSDTATGLNQLKRQRACNW